jgi:hypothetical protein
MNRRMIINGVVYDPRTLEEAKQMRLEILRHHTQENIIDQEGLDQMTQINAALGIYDTERTQAITDKINFWRDKFLAAKAAIEAATTNEQVDSINL